MLIHFSYVKKFVFTPWKVTVFALMCGVLTIALLGDDSTTAVGRVRIALGEVEYKGIQSPDWKPISINESVYSNDQIKTGEKSRCEIRLSGKRVVRIGERTTVTIVDNHEETNCEIKKGKAWIKQIFFPENKKLKVNTPTAVAAIRGTTYRMNCDSISTKIRVYDGVVEIGIKNQLKSDRAYFLLDSLTEMVITNDVDQFKINQTKEYEKYAREFEDDFEAYKKEFEKEFQSFKKLNKNDFTLIESAYVLEQEFTIESEISNNWVQWNMDLDFEYDLDSDY